MDRVKRQPADLGMLALSVFAAVLFYVFSFAPVAVLVQHRGLKPNEVRLFEVVYAPIVFVCEKSETVRRGFDAYLALWGFK